MEFLKFILKSLFILATIILMVAPLALEFYTFRRDKEKKKRRHPILRLLWYGKNNDEEKECDTLTFDTPHRRMELSETANLYLQALNKLPYTWQRILLMRGEEEKSYAEIAEILGTSDSSIRATLCTAKKKIMQYLNHDL